MNHLQELVRSQEPMRGIETKEMIVVAFHLTATRKQVPTPGQPVNGLSNLRPYRRPILTPLGGGF
jgi:hypothetical protein